MNVQSKKEKKLETRIIDLGSNFLSPPDDQYRLATKPSVESRPVKAKITALPYESRPQSMDMSCYAGSGF